MCILWAHTGATGCVGLKFTLKQQLELHANYGEVRYIRTGNRSLSNVASLPSVAGNGVWKNSGTRVSSYGYISNVRSILRVEV